MASPTAARPLPRSLATLAGALASIEPPTGDFDPNAEWEHGYTLHTVVYAPNGQSVNVPAQGWLRIRRHRIAAKAFELSCTLASHHGGGYAAVVDAEITCANDRLASPRRWEVTCRTLDREGSPVPDTEHARSGAIRKGRIVTTSGERRARPAPGPLSSNWSLFDAVQRLPFDSGDRIRFAMLEGMDLLKADQQLSYRGICEVELGGEMRRLHGFEQFGRGILPYAYWLDDRRRLLIACGGMRAFLWNPSAGGAAA